jgi:hypothetical protein
MTLARHTQANREFFAKGKAPTLDEWRVWISKGVVKGKMIDDKPWIDLQWFAANDTMNGSPERQSVVDFLSEDD